MRKSGLQNTYNNQSKILFAVSFALLLLVFMTAVDYLLTEDRKGLFASVLYILKSLLLNGATSANLATFIFYSNHVVHRYRHINEHFR